MLPARASFISYWVAHQCPIGCPSTCICCAGAEFDAPVALGYDADVTAAQMAALGLTATQAAALGGRLDRRTALHVAVATGSVEAAGALLCAGASLAPQTFSPIYQPTVFRDLLHLTEVTAVEPGDAAAAVPAAVQRMASVLLAHGLPPGAASSKAHETAVKLAYPKPPHGGGAAQPQPPPCGWMLQHLLQMHTSGQLGSAHAAAVADVVEALTEHAAGEPGVEAVVAQWLSVPAAADIEAHRLGCRLLEQGVAGEALSALLAQPGAAAALQQRASECVFDSLNIAFRPSLVASAAASERSEALDAVFAAGGTVTLNDINRFSVLRWRSPQGLALLLNRGVPPVTIESPPGQVFPWSACPIYTLLQGFSHKWVLVRHNSTCCGLRYRCCARPMRQHRPAALSLGMQPSVGRMLCGCRVLAVGWFAADAVAPLPSRCLSVSA